MHVCLRPGPTSIPAPTEDRSPHFPYPNAKPQASSSRSSLLQSRNICSLIVHVSDGVSSFVCSFSDRPADRLGLGGLPRTLRVYSSQSSFSPAVATCTAGWCAFDGDAPLLLLLGGITLWVASGRSALHHHHRPHRESKAGFLGGTTEGRG